MTLMSSFRSIYMEAIFATTKIDDIITMKYRRISGVIDPSSVSMTNSSLLAWEPLSNNCLQLPDRHLSTYPSATATALRL